MYIDIHVYSHVYVCSGVCPPLNVHGFIASYVFPWALSQQELASLLATVAESIAGGCKALPPASSVRLLVAICVLQGHSMAEVTSAAFLRLAL